MTCSKATGGGERRLRDEPGLEITAVLSGPDPCQSHVDHGYMILISRNEASQERATEVKWLG